jgi:ribokinase/sulfofructose kinase
MIVFCGYANHDVLTRVERMPAAGERIQATAVDHISGGTGANAAVAAARARASVAFAGAIGRDERSASFLRELETEGIDTTWTNRDSFLTTAIVLVAADGERSIISQDDGLTPNLVLAAARRLSDAGGGWLYTDGYRWPSLLDDDDLPGVRLVVDLDGCTDRDAALQALGRAEHLIVGRPLWEVEFGFAESDWPHLAARNNTYLIVTDGARGWTLVSPSGHVTTEPALAVQTVDATGAGDCFVGTYIALLERGEPPAEAAHLAGIAAGLACTVEGGRGAPRFEDIETHASHTAVSTDR